jgi:4-azaleucine resistance transporter AzlC
MMSDDVRKTAHGDSLWAEARAGLAAIAPVVISVAAYGLLLGALAAQKGLSPLETFAMSALVFAGSAQFVALDLWSVPAAVWTLGATALVVNLRHVLMGAALAPAMRSWPRGLAPVAVFFMADENWALSLRRAAEGRLGPAFYMAMALALYGTWTASTTLGSILGSGLHDPARWGLDFAFTAVFIVLVMGFWRGPRASLPPWAAAAAAAVVVEATVPGAWYILAGGLAGSLAGALQSRGVVS